MYSRINDQIFFIASLGSAVTIFVAARLILVSPKYFLVADAAGLATFWCCGNVGFTYGWSAPALLQGFLGVMTGTMGGIFRDVLCNETPVVFLSPLYATVSWVGSLLFIGLLHFDQEITVAAIISGLSIFISRLLAMYYKVSLPRFRFKS